MTHPRLTRRQAEVLRARCETGSRKAAGELLGMSEWNVGRVLRAIRCCADDAQAGWAHRVELEPVKT